MGRVRFLDHLPLVSEKRKADRVRRLAGQARWRHDGGAGKRRQREGWRAWAGLIAIGDSMKPSRPWRVARDLVWELWFREPDDAGWAALTRWHGGKALTDLLTIVACRQDQGDWAALTAFCARRGLAPEKQAERAGFYLLTGQHDRRRALDPHGTLLAAAYWAASPCHGERERLWKALVASEDLDGMRAVVEARSRRYRVSAADRQHVIELRGDLDDPDERWRRAQNLRLLDAAAAIATIRPGWRPDGQSGSSLFALLAAADLASLRDARSALSRPRARTMNALRRLTDQPLAGWQPEDLNVALAALRNMDRYPAVRPLCELLIRCLECQFGDDIPIGADAK